MATEAHSFAASVGPLPWSQMDDTTKAQARALVGRLTDAEKVSLTAGADAWTTTAVDRLGIPAIRLGDGPHGVRKPHDGAGMSMFDSHPATCFPTAAALGSTWDPELVRLVGEALGRESAAHGIAVLLGPGVNLKRTPVGGRDFEYFSEDPLVSARMGAAWVRGVQSTGVGASLKHFAANNTERRRYGVDAVVDKRALRELYLACFERVVIDERPATVMAAYNRLNGEHCTENSRLLRDILRGEWGFDGVVVSDWGAAWDRMISVPAGNDLAMPGLGRRDDRYVRRALRSGALARRALDESAARILQLVGRHAGATGAGDAPDLDAHHALARRAAAAGTVLLKNDGVLPIGPSGRIAVIGAFAKEPRFQGAGSSHVVPTRLDTLLDSLVEAVGIDRVVYAPGYDRVHNESTAALIAEAQSAAREADVAVVVIGLPEVFETEGVDREHLRLPEAHDRLVEAVRAVNAETVVVLQNGSPVEMPWLDSVPAVVEAYLGGQAGGSALAEVLLGEAEPGGRLAETFPVRYADHPESWLPNGPATVEYRESLYVGYRYFDSAGEAVAFPFGHGLSYTTFDWSDVAVSGSDSSGVGGSSDADVEVRLVVSNTGTRAGAEVVQVYVHDLESSVFRPQQELKGFAKVELAAGGRETVSIQLDRRAFSFWNTSAGAWVLEPGRFEIRVGRSSRDIRWRSTIELGAPGDDGDRDDLPALGSEGREPGDLSSFYRAPSKRAGFPVAEFERLLGHPVPRNVPAGPGEFTLDTAVSDMQQTLPGRLLFRFLARQAVKTIGAPSEAPVEMVAGDVVAQLNFRMLPTVSDGLIGRRGARRLLALVNLLSRIGRGRARL
ncbi:glycoside hydrolase family 3 C-terminal domain-containing protein [Herbiconiux daphne]|uniref:Glycoside hydrolase family 3 C-terminal domain-containing protein n=1 Tax=Herbiconiux daphne TaxID=2970914 RepID=A0ABT2H0P5_9MICO|nr:glycoside hydrolase family 3 C-terminal domain-containing protein [Herbiconiux daphne]MCS5733504.1 glycoside hydrolase family 3 C-terminal domain-containing protein [Herbiconiux daphne]